MRSLIHRQARPGGRSTSMGPCIVVPKRIVALVLAAAISLALPSLSGCATAQPAGSGAASTAPQAISIYGFAPGTSTQLRADAIAEAIRLEYPGWMVSSMAAGGEAKLTNLRLEGKADLFFPMSPRPLELQVQEPLHADVDFAALTDYRVVSPSSLLYLHLLTSDKARFDAPEDLVSQTDPFTVACGAGVMRLLLESILEYYGSSMEKIEAKGAKYELLLVSSPEGTEALATGRIDVGLTWLGVPGAMFLGISSSEVGLMPITDPGLLNMLASLGCVPVSIAAGAYPFVKVDVPTVAAPMPLVARANLPEDVVYAVTNAIYSHTDLLVAAHGESARFMTRESVAEAVADSVRLGVRFHDGALRYYREQGWVD